MLDKELIAKVDEAYGSKDCFVGNYDDFTDDDLEQIYKETQDIISDVLSGERIKPFTQENKIIFLALVELTKKWGADDDESGWLDFLAKKLIGNGKMVGKAYDIVIRNCIRDLEANGLIFTLKSIRTKYYATTCCHALAPVNSMNSLFELCWNVFSDEMNEGEFSSDVDDFSHRVAACLKNRFSLEPESNEEIVLGSHPYGLRIGVRGLSLDRDDILASLLKEILENIYCFVQKKSRIHSDYLTRIERNWWEEKVRLIGISAVRRRTRHTEDIARDYTSINVRYIYQDGDVQLYVPRIRLCAEDLSSPLILRVWNGDIQLKNKSLHITGAMTTDEERFNLDDLIGKEKDRIKVSIAIGEREIYSSKEDLFRDAILFDSASGREVKDSSLVPGSYFIRVSRYEELESGTALDSIRNVGVNIFTFTAKEGDYLVCAGRTVFFESERNDKRVGFSCSLKENVSLSVGGREYRITDGDVHLFVGKDIDTDSLWIKAQEELYRPGDFPCSSSGDVKSIDISKIIPEGVPTSLIVSQGNDLKPICSLDVVRYNIFQISYGLPLYYASSNRVDNLSAGHVAVVIDGDQYENVFEKDQSEFSVPVKGGRIIYTPPIFRWSLTGETEWHSDPSTMYCQEINEVTRLKLDIPSKEDYTVMNLDGEIPRTDDETFPIGEFISSSKVRNKRREETIFLSFQGDFYEILRVFLEPTFMDSEPLSIDSQDKSVMIDMSSFIGPDNPDLQLIVSDDKGSEVFSCSVTDSGAPIDLSSIPDGEYHLSISLQELFTSKIIYETDHLLGDSRTFRFRGKALRLKQIKNIASFEFLDLRVEYRIADISFVRKVDGYDIYSGNLY